MENLWRGWKKWPALWTTCRAVERTVGGDGWLELSFRWANQQASIKSRSNKRMKSSSYLKHKWSTERGWPCIFARAVCATRPWGGLFGLAQSCQGGSHPSKRYEWRPLWPVMIFSLLFNRRPAFQHGIIRRAHLKSMGGSLEEPRNNFCRSGLGRRGLGVGDPFCLSLKLSLEQYEIVEPGPRPFDTSHSGDTTTLYHHLITLLSKFWFRTCERGRFLFRVNVLCR